MGLTSVYREVEVLNHAKFAEDLVEVVLIDVLGQLLNDDLG